MHLAEKVQDKICKNRDGFSLEVEIDVAHFAKQEKET
jgi:hypothetical protein